MTENLDLNNTNVDSDLFRESISSVFPTKYHLALEQPIGKKDVFVLHLSVNNKNEEVATALSNEDILTFDTETLSNIRRFNQSHNSGITQIRYSHKEPSKLFTSSMDQTIKLWDVRDKSQDPAIVYSIHNPSTDPQYKQREPKPIMSFDISADDKMICAGSEQVLRDAFLLFWDIRKPSLVGGYWESHEDDISTVKFHPTEKDKLATSGTDGLVNVFDISQSDEDDALETSINTNSSVQNLTWFHDKNGDWNSLACTTHTEEVHLWNVDDVGPYHVFKREDISIGIQRNVSELTYIIGTWEQKIQDDYKLMILAASSCSQNPCIRLMKLKKKKLKPEAHFQMDQNITELSRCFYHLPNSNSFITGGEDGYLRLWNYGEKPEQPLKKKKK